MRICVFVDITLRLRMIFLVRLVRGLTGDDNCNDDDDDDVKIEYLALIYFGHYIRDLLVIPTAQLLRHSPYNGAEVCTCRRR